MNSIVTAELIRTAIRQRRTVAMKFSDEQVRFVEPYAFGRNACGDNLVIAFQTRGPTGESSGWKVLAIDKITEARVLDQQFGSREGYEHNHSALDGLIYGQLTS